MAGFSTSWRPPLLAGLLLLLASGSLPLTGCGDDPASPELSGDDLFQLVVGSEDLQQIEDVVRGLALDMALRTESDLTFFAPTDEALLGLGPDMLALLNTPANREILRKLVRRHLVRGRYRAADLRDGETLTPLEGPPLVVRVDGETISVSGAEITDADLEAGNGVLHEIDEVVRDHLTLAERLRVTPLIATFASALERADLTDLVTSGEPYTLLIPINSGFADLGAAELQSLLSTPNRSLLLKVLRHHILPGRVRAEQFADGTALAPLGDLPLPVEAENGLTYVGGARVIVPEIETSDGLIYLLDSVVLSHLSVAERMQILPRLSTSYAILRGAGLFTQLNGTDPFTVLVPTDAAWTPLGTQFLGALNARPDLLLRTAQQLVVPGRFDREDLLEGGTLTTLGGYTLPVLVRRDVTRTDIFVGDRAVVAFPPYEASNGLIYGMAPFNVPPGLDLEERAVFAALYRFLNLIERGNLTSLLQSEGPYTVFAPSDAALDGLGLPTDQIPQFIRRHIVEGRFEVSDLPATLSTLEGTEIEVFTVDNQLALNCVLVEEPPPPHLEDCIFVTSVNNHATNGVIHIIDGVLTP